MYFRNDVNEKNYVGAASEHYRCDLVGFYERLIFTHNCVPTNVYLRNNIV